MQRFTKAESSLITQDVSIIENQTQHPDVEIIPLWQFLLNEN